MLYTLSLVVDPLLAFVCKYSRPTINCCTSADSGATSAMNVCAPLTGTMKCGARAK